MASLCRTITFFGAGNTVSPTLARGNQQLARCNMTDAPGPPGSPRAAAERIKRAVVPCGEKLRRTCQSAETGGLRGACRTAVRAGQKKDAMANMPSRAGAGRRFGPTRRRSRHHGRHCESGDGSDGVAHHGCLTREGGIKTSATPPDPRPRPPAALPEDGEGPDVTPQARRAAGAASASRLAARAASSVRSGPEQPRARSETGG
jgi:hypothetical protein